MEDNSLYKAACEAAVSQSTADSCFSKMVVAACVHSTAEEFRDECKIIEKQVIKDLEISVMPNPWRSAKSVCYTALKFSIGFYDENGVPKGKSRLQNEIKMKKEEGKTDKTPFENFEARLSLLAFSISKLTDDEAKHAYSVIKNQFGLFL